MTLQERYQQLSPKNKKSLVIAASVVTGLILLLLLYNAANVKKTPAAAAGQKTVSTTNFVGAEDRNTSIKLGVDKKLDTVMARIDKLEKNGGATPGETGTQQNQQGTAAQPDTALSMNQSIQSGAKPPMFSDLKDVPAPVVKQAYPQSPQLSQQPSLGSSAGYAGYQKAPEKPVERMVSDIGFLTVSAADTDKDKTASEPQKHKKTNWIPSNSIFKATLVTGVYAPTLAAGKQSPYPVVMRLRDLSFFPNEFRKDLSGCYLGGEAYGNLSDERVSIRLNNLSCLSDRNKTVVDVPVSGYVQGEDGIIGLAGRVVSKQGQLMAAAFVSSFLEGMGKAFGLANQTTSVTALGGTTTAVNGSEILKYGVGSGFEESFKMLAKYYTDILNDTAPVIEVLGGRKVEVVINKGVDISPEEWEWNDIK